ncbi:MAG: preprotein translocase subunit SecA, partial [Chloroflexota bacterium]|nr:preprotein translocase subunit SecA [Chloroflexota bacterium]
EMKTGEGKTFVAPLAAYLNALDGLGVHVVTVNDYLARRDAAWMGQVFDYLGLTVGCLQHEAALLFTREAASEAHSLRPVSRSEAYQADVLYGTNNEFGFDYLRDNMARDLSQKVQRQLHYAIVDEVDNILIDEARTPLIISGQAEQNVAVYYQFAQYANRLQDVRDYVVDQKHRTVNLTDEGISRAEKLLSIPDGESLYDPRFFESTHYLDNALKAKALYLRDRDYAIQDGQIIIVDEFTGRFMYGRRYSEGLHQAIEAKEGVRVERESQTLATITIQNYFRMYKKLAGMTGTAATEAEEFGKIYNMDVVQIPTHRPMIRVDHPDRIYKTESGKFKAVADEIEELHRDGRPVLVGTTSIEKSEELSELLRRRGIKHEVLNAKYHEKEAVIVAQAGQPSAVTIATNMAGRGTDILLGGTEELYLQDVLKAHGIEPEQDGHAPRELQEETERRWEQAHNEVVKRGGLHIIGTERHESRRIDNQLRGRSGRQGDPGSSRFYVSLEDELMVRFGLSRVAGIMERLGVGDDTPIEAGIVTKQIEGAQAKAEGYNFDIRKHVVEYDSVMNRQREVIYAMRDRILSGDNTRERVLEMVHGELDAFVDSYTSEEEPSEWNLDGLLRAVDTVFPLPADVTSQSLAGLEPAEIQDFLHELADEAYAEKEMEAGEEDMRMLERMLMLHTIDTFWVEYLTSIEELRQGIGLRAYAQRDPLVEYKSEAFHLFEDLVKNIEHEVAMSVFKVSLTREVVAAPQETGTNRDDEAAPKQRRKERKIGRNEPCWCGSGKKYKRCHGLSAA